VGKKRRGRWVRRGGAGGQEGAGQVGKKGRGQVGKEGRGRWVRRGGAAVRI
jgi:hypothetical protein